MPKWKGPKGPTSKQQLPILQQTDLPPAKAKEWHKHQAECLSARRDGRPLRGLPEANPIWTQRESTNIQNSGLYKLPPEVRFEIAKHMDDTTRQAIRRISGAFMQMIGELDLRRIRDRGTNPHTHNLVQFVFLRILDRSAWPLPINGPLWGTRAAREHLKAWLADDTSGLCQNCRAVPGYESLRNWRTSRAGHAIAGISITLPCSPHGERMGCISTAQSQCSI